MPRDVIDQLLAAQRIAVVGLSDDTTRPSYLVSQYLLEAGREIIPVNPNAETVLGQKAYPTLEAIPGRIDLINVFRRPGFAPAIVQSAIELQAGGVWLQSGIVSPQAAQLAQDAGLPFIQDVCIMVEHARRLRHQG